MQAWTEAEKSMSKPSCFLILNQESNQRGKLEYLVPLCVKGDFWVGKLNSGTERPTLQAGGMQQTLLVGSKLPVERGHERRSSFEEHFNFYTTGTY